MHHWEKSNEQTLRNKRYCVHYSQNWYTCTCSQLSTPQPTDASNIVRKWYFHQRNMVERTQKEIHTEHVCLMFHMISIFSDILRVSNMRQATNATNKRFSVQCYLRLALDSWIGAHKLAMYSRASCTQQAMRSIKAACGAGFDYKLCHKNLLLYTPLETWLDTMCNP